MVIGIAKIDAKLFFRNNISAAYCSLKTAVTKKTRNLLKYFYKIIYYDQMLSLSKAALSTLNSRQVASSACSKMNAYCRSFTHPSVIPELVGTTSYLFYKFIVILIYSKVNFHLLKQL